MIIKYNGGIIKLMRLSQISMYVPEDVKEGLKQLAEENYQMFSDYSIFCQFIHVNVVHVCVYRN